MGEPDSSFSDCESDYGDLIDEVYQYLTDGR